MRRTLFTMALGFALVQGRAGNVRQVQAEPIHSVPTITLGSDYLQTQPGSFLDFGGAIGVVSFKGLPAGPGQSDTIVQRQADATINGAAIPIQLVALSLRSTQPVNLGGSFFDVFISLDAAHLGDDTGQMTIFEGPSGNTFKSFYEVYFDAQFIPHGPGVLFDIFGQTRMSQQGAAWSSIPPPVVFPWFVIVTGPDDDSNRDQAGNSHTGLDPMELDFFILSAVENRSPLGQQNLSWARAAVPEPGSLTMLIGAGLVVLAGCHQHWPRRRTSTK